MTVSIVIQLDPEKLANPDLDLRYELPNLISERSGGTVRDDGYDYAGTSRYLQVFLAAESAEEGLRHVLNGLQAGPVLENDLATSAVVGAREGDGYRVVVPTATSATIDVKESR